MGADIRFGCQFLVSVRRAMGSLRRSLRISVGDSVGFCLHAETNNPQPTNQPTRDDPAATSHRWHCKTW